MVEIAGILTYIRVQILEVCKEWVEMKDICARTQKSRTTVLHHMEVLKNAGMIEETMIGVMRTRKKLYKAKPFKVEVGKRGDSGGKMVVTKTEGPGDTT